MIQRIQSVYLILTILFAVLFLSGNILKFSGDSGDILTVTMGGLSRITGESAHENLGKSFPITILVILIPVLSFVAIFLYRNRKLQMRFTLGLFILTVVVIVAEGIYSVYLMRNYNADMNWGIKMILPLMMAVCTYLAYRGIKKDKDLVKSYDRLR
ncbi:MAG: DUF4293 domain-containing protein [Bacteroidia bacterium]|nr:DUF4293 domain-containing protein [Bacteroidia bacterium]